MRRGARLVFSRAKTPLTPEIASAGRPRRSASGRAASDINISSLSGILNTPMNGTYCISKHALESMGEIYRRELIADGIDVAQDLQRHQ